MNPKLHIYSNEGKGNYILVDDLIEWIEEKQINVPSNFNDVKAIYRYSLQDIKSYLTNPNNSL